jgi:WD40 repeat protein
MLTGTEAGNLVLWSIGDGEPQTLASAGPAVTSVAWSPDATTWAVGRGDGSVEIWTTTGDGQP